MTYDRIIKLMYQGFIISLMFGMMSCYHDAVNQENAKAGSFSGLFQFGTFSDQIQFEIEEDSVGFDVFFTSLAQNANRIPLQNVKVSGDSIFFSLQSDFYTYEFRNKWISHYSQLQGSLTVDTITALYQLEKQRNDKSKWPQREDVSFESDGLQLFGTIWYPEYNDGKALIIITSSGNADRSASRAEAILLAQRGFTTFHYDKRGTGRSQGDWNKASIEQLAADDISAISYFSGKTGIPLSDIGIKGSSQGAAKIPYILNVLSNLKYGVVVSCPGVSLLESDLNYWRNQNADLLGTDIEAATQCQRKVFEFIAGIRSRRDLEKAIEKEKSKAWFSYIWLPDPDEILTDHKLLYTPIPYFETIVQPVLIIQGEMDEIIPQNSYTLITAALRKSGHGNYRAVVLEGASHSMYYKGGSDFPYWSKLHSGYLTTVEEWIHSVYHDEGIVQ